MSRYLDKEQQERFDRIINDFASQFDSSQSGLTVKVGTTTVYRTGVENKPNIDRIKPFELEKLEAAVNLTESAKGTVEIALYTPAIEEVFRYENGDIRSINKQRANGRTKETEEDPLQAQLLNQRPTIQPQAEPQQEFDTQSPTQDPENQQANNQIYLDKEFGYLSTDYYLRDASPIFGEWAKQFTPNGIHLMSQMGLDWQYFADKYESQKAAQPALAPAAELPQLPPGQEQPTIDIQAQTIAQTDPTIFNQQLVETLAQMQQQIADIQKQLESMQKQQAERLEQAPKPQENRLTKWMDGIKENFSTKAQEIGDAIKGGIDYFKDTTRELVGAGLEATTKLAVDLVGDRQSDGSKLLATGNIEYRLQGQQLSAQSQQQDWANLSLQERLQAIRTQYGITQPSPGEKQQQQYQERSR
ncbi:hypothetical protein [Iningainema tapete]|uniref:Uncharacterized protein n=1 Tax=Iningainema tapete BLCC-T55 TaxID=2748662 RepID=A0A8J6XNI3_9CYAN|nr:hypothetical protein [Iningainema tapete]MBD2774306.1 hypothetical protein [Iningainema tapete BLCC-T55]